MLNTAQARELVNQIFEEEALLLAGIVAVHKPDDDLVWRLARNLDLLRGRVLRRLDAGDAEDAGQNQWPNLTPRPAIEHLLQSIRNG